MLTDTSIRLMTSVYYILAGPDKGAVITRAEDSVLNVREIDDKHWYVI